MPLRTYSVCRPRMMSFACVGPRGRSCQLCPSFAYEEVTAFARGWEGGPQKSPRLRRPPDRRCYNRRFPSHHDGPRGSRTSAGGRPGMAKTALPPVSDPTPPDLSGLGLRRPGEVYANLPPAALTERALARSEALLAERGALVAYTGERTGRSP